MLYFLALAIKKPYEVKMEHLVSPVQRRLVQWYSCSVVRAQLVQDRETLGVDSQQLLALSLFRILASYHYKDVFMCMFVFLLHTHLIWNDDIFKRDATGVGCTLTHVPLLNDREKWGTRKESEE